MVNRVKVIDHVSAKIFFILKPIIGLVLTFVIVYGVICRYFLRQPDVRVYFLSVWIMGICYLFSFGYTLLLRGHVSVDILYNYLPKKARRVLDLIGLAVIVISCIVLLPSAISYAWRSTLINELDSTMPMFAPPIWWYKWCLVIALILAAFQTVAELFKTLKRKAGGD
mgnify:CR=1 FL=1